LVGSNAGAIVGTFALGNPWLATDPFLFCAYHNDRYPEGTPQMGPATGTAGRQLGQDFSAKDGWNMYHGLEVPGFPAHPHRGFETITVVRQGVTVHTSRFREGLYAKLDRIRIDEFKADGLPLSEVIKYLDDEARKRDLDKVGVNFIINAESDSFAQGFARVHGPCACAMAFRVKDAPAALARAVKLGATAIAGKPGPMELNIPAILGIGGSLIFLVDRYGDSSIYDTDFIPVAEHGLNSAGLTFIDHLTHNVYPGHMDQWAKFYEDIFNFREIHYFDIKGQQTGLTSRAMTRSLIMNWSLE